MARTMRSFLAMTAEEQVLQTFARHDATTLQATLLAQESDAIGDLEREHALLRYQWDGTEWVTLTLRGLARRGGVPPGTTAVAPQIVYEHPHQFPINGHIYSVYVLGCPRAGGTWAGWIEFVPHDGAQRLRTGQETSQPNRDALVYWASGLEDIYFDGALSRAGE